jgi:hypothetical protein
MTALLPGEGCCWDGEYADSAQPGWHLHGAVPGAGPGRATPPLGATLDPLQDQQQVNLRCYFVFVNLFRPQRKSVVMCIRMRNKLHSIINVILVKGFFIKSSAFSQKSL